MCIEFFDLPICIKSLALCDQEQLNSIAHLIETKSVSLNEKPSGFMFITKKEQRKITTINQLAEYYQSITHQRLRIVRY